MRRQTSTLVSNTAVISIPCIAGVITLFAMVAFGSSRVTAEVPPIVVAPISVVVPSIEQPKCEPSTPVPVRTFYETFLDAEHTLVTIPNKINADQAAVLKYAYEVAEKDGHRDPTILQGLIWQESKAGGYPGHEVAGDEYGLKVGKRYYGVGQIKVAAAKDVIKRFPADFLAFRDMTDDEIIAYLILDQEFNIRVASKYLWMMGHNETKKPVYKRPTNYAITAYNRGLGNTYDTDYNNWHYTVSVHEHKDTFIKTFNLANNIAK